MSSWFGFSSTSSGVYQQFHAIDLWRLAYAQKSQGYTRKGSSCFRFIQHRGILRNVIFLNSCDPSLRVSVYKSGPLMNLVIIGNSKRLTFANERRPCVGTLVTALGTLSSVLRYESLVQKGFTEEYG